VVFGFCCLVALATSLAVHAQRPAPAQAVDEGGAPQFKVDPFWPKPLPNKWSMQQVTGISVDYMDHVWFLNRAAAAEGDEIGGSAEGPSRIDCCVRGPEVIELDQEGNVVHAWGGPGYHPLWPTALQTVIPDSKGYVWVSGTGAQDSILKFTRDGKFVWDFGHRPPAGQPFQETNQNTDMFVSKGRFQLDEMTNEIYIINQKRVMVFDATTGAFKRGWGGHGMPLSEVTNERISSYTWTGAPPPDEKNFVPDLHFVEISKDRLVYVGERGQNRIEVFTTDGKFVKEFYVSPNTPGQRVTEGCGGLQNTKMPPCGTTYKLAISRDPQQKYLYVADGTNNKVWILDRQSGKTLGSFGSNGRYAGQLHWINAIAMDSKGNIYTGEVEQAKRIQKFAPVMRTGR
jgi:DNA-binding beta-propeller fold protein YncE